jgi:hypothetical protein
VRIVSGSFSLAQIGRARGYRKAALSTGVIRLESPSISEARKDGGIEMFEWELDALASDYMAHNSCDAGTLVRHGRIIDARNTPTEVDDWHRMVEVNGGILNSLGCSLGGSIFDGAADSQLVHELNLFGVV